MSTTSPGPIATIPWSATTASRLPGGRPSTMDSTRRSTWRNCMRHGCGTRAVQVAQQVEFAVVAVAEPTAYQCRAHVRGQITESQHADVAAAAQHGAGQTGAGEFGAGHDADRDAGGRRPFERRRQRLHVFRHQRVAHVLAPRMRPPAQRIDQPGLRAAGRTCRPARARRSGSRCRQRPARRPWSTGSRPAAWVRATRPVRARRGRRCPAVRRRDRRSAARRRRRAGPGRPIRSSKPGTPSAVSSAGTTSARCGSPGSGCGRSTPRACHAGPTARCAD